MTAAVPINLVAVLVAAIVGFALGGLWYHPKVLGHRWMQALGKSREQLGSPGRAMSLNFLTTLLTALTLAFLLALMGVSGALDGAYLALIAAVGLLGTTLYADYLFANSSPRLLLITGGYRILHIVIMGAIHRRLVRRKKTGSIYCPSLHRD